jgi:hypothetical protein
MFVAHRTPEVKIHAGSAENTRGGRLVYLDALRGLLLVVMAINHIPNDLHVITDHPFGYMSAAEGFVFLSGLMAGLVYSRRLARGGVGDLHRSCWARARTVYFFHLVGYIGVFALVTAHRAWTGGMLPNTPLQMATHPLRALFIGPLLLSQPSLLDILPFYCGFMLLCPVLIRAYEAGQRRRVLAVSFLVWAAVNWLSPQQPLLNTPTFNSGAFNIFAWQILFVVGTAFGHAWARGERLVVNSSRSVLVPILAVAVLFFAIRHAWIPSGLSSDTLSWLTNKNNLAPLRLFNTALIFWLLHSLIVRYPRALSWRPLALLGRESLPAFTIHVLIAYAITAYPQFFDRTPASRLLGTCTLLGAMTLTALAASRWRLAQAARENSAPAKSGLASRDGPALAGQWQTNDWPNRSASSSRWINSKKYSGRPSSLKAVAAKMTPSIPGT